MRNHQVNINRFDVHSNYDSNSPVNLSGGVGQLDYVESLLYNTVKCKVLLTDVGARVGGENVSAMEEEGKKLVGAEKVYLQLEDPFLNKIDFSKEDKHLKIQKVRYFYKNVFSSLIEIIMWSKESEDNHKESCRVKKTYQGKISDSVRSILSEVLGTEKDLHIEETFNRLNFNGSFRKPFTELNNLAMKSVSSLFTSIGNSAGFWFWEDSRGYHFKSIDYLMQQPAKKRYIMRDIVEGETFPIPAEYNGLIYSAIPQKNFDVEEILETGSLSASRLEFLEPYTSAHAEDTYNVQDSQADSIAGKEFPRLDGLEDEVTSRNFRISDAGYYSTGADLTEQLTHSTEINFNVVDILRQSESRIRNMFSVKLIIKIKSDLSLHPGDMIHCDFREISLKSQQEISNKESGLYMIVTIRHKITPNGDSFSIIDLVRDSIGRKPF